MSLNGIGIIIHISPFYFILENVYVSKKYEYVLGGQGDMSPHKYFGFPCKRITIQKL